MATSLPRPAAVTARQQDIQDRATELFARDGYRAVGMRAIADAVGVRTSSLYHHFPSKEEILFAISLRVTKVYMEEHRDTIFGDGAAPDRLAAIIRVHVHYFFEHRLEQSVGNRELRELSDLHLAEVLGHKRRYQHRIRNILAAGMASDDFVSANPDIAALSLLTMLNGLNVWFDPDGDVQVDELAELHVASGLRLMGVANA